MRTTEILLVVTLLVSGAAGTGQARPPTSAARLDTLISRIEKGKVSFKTAIDMWLLMDMRDLADSASRERIHSVLEKISDNRSAPVPLKRLALRMLGRLQSSAGREQESKRTLQRLADVSDWWIIGPFDNEGHRGFDAVYGPEQRIDLGRAEPGKVRPVRWRSAPVRPADGRMLLHPLFSPQTKSVAYALAALSAPRPTPGLLHLGCDDGCKVWINGELVLSDPGSHSLRFDQHSLELTLEPGFNLILVKAAQDEGEWGFTLSFTDKRGERIDQLKTASTREELEQALAAPGVPPKQPRPLTTLAAWFWDLAQKSPDDPLVLAQAALALSRSEAFDQKQQRVDDLVHRCLQSLKQAKIPHPQGVEILLLLAQATSDDNLSRRLLRQAAAADPYRPEALSRLGTAYHIRNEPEKAWEAHARALQNDPGHLPSQLESVELLYKLGLSGRAQTRIDNLLQRHPDVFEVLVVAANLYRRMGHVRRARSLYLKLAALKTDSQLALRALFELAAARGDLPDALAWLDKLLDLDPLRIGWWIERGDLLLHNQKPGQALSDYRRAVAICPEESLGLVREGLALQALGRTEECLRRFKAAQLLAPQDRDLERHIESLQPRKEAFYQPWAVDPTATNLPGISLSTDADAGAGTVRILDQTVVRLHPNGMTSSYRQQLIGILSDRGAEHARTFRIEYAPARQQVRILRSRVFRPDGQLDASVLVNDYSLSEPWYNLYYDVHAREVTFPALAPGDLVELTYLTDDVGSQSLLGDYFGDLVPFQFAEPVRKVSYILLAPAKYPLHANRPASVRHHEQAGPDGVVVHTWEASDMPPVEPEPDMPGFTETHAFLHVSSHENWSGLARWYHGLISDQLVPGPEVKRLANALVEGLVDPQEKIRAIHRFVADRTRYVGLEFGIHSYVPYQASQVLQRKFGDCKDKSALLVAMFNEVGIKAHLALVRMNQLGHVPRVPASLAIFNHAVCYLPDHDLWLDATASFHDIQDLPTQDQSVEALIITRNGGRLVRTPTSTPERNRTEISFDVQPGAQGGAKVLSRVAVSGSVAPAIRAQLSGSATRQAAIEKILNELFPGAQVSSVNIENLKRPDLPLISTAELNLPITTGSDRQIIDVPVLGRNTTYQKIFTPFQDRRFDLLLAPPWSVKWSVSISSPPGYQLPELPDSGNLKSSFGSAGISYTREGQRVLIQAEFRLILRRIEASDYPAFRSFLGKVDHLFGRRLRFTRGRSAGS